jgi:molybdopterin/thiamine biosynthesis adenylyltransferase
MNDETPIVSHIKKCVRTHKRPDGSSYDALLLADARGIARDFELPLNRVEAVALRENILPERYSRNQKTLSCADQLKLLEAHIAVIGLGGLGGTVAEILARLGIGTITLVDGDTFDESNLNRQLFCTTSTLGQSKAEAAEARLKSVNPAVQPIPFKEFFSAVNSGRLLAGVDLAVDCLDTITDRFVLEQACRKNSIPLISAAIGGTSGQATVIFPEDEGLRSIYGTAETAPSRGAEAAYGTLPFAAFYMAAVECAALAGLLLSGSSNLRNRLFVAEVADHTTELFHLGP